MFSVVLRDPKPAFAFCLQARLITFSLTSLRSSQTSKHRHNLNQKEFC